MWFSITSGPAELFERVRFVMQDKALSVNSDKIKKAVAYFVGDEVAQLQNINLKDWSVEGAEVLVNSGKFITSIWRRKIGLRSWRIVISRNNVVSGMLIKKNAKLRSSECPSSFKAFVSRVSRKLMADDGHPIPSNRKRNREAKRLPVQIPSLTTSPKARSIAPRMTVRRAAKRPDPEPPVSISKLRSLANGAEQRLEVVEGYCRFCGRPAVRGEDTCYSCG